MLKNLANLQALDQLVDMAMTKQHQPITLISSLLEATRLMQYRFAILQVWRSFSKLKKNIYKAYLKQLKKGQRDHTLLACFVQMRQCEVFYKEEWFIVDYFIREFITYTCSGHILDMLLGKVRDSQDLWDHLRPPED